MTFIRSWLRGRFLASDKVIDRLVQLGFFKFVDEERVEELIHLERDKLAAED